MDLEGDLLAIFDGHKVLMPNSQRELLTGLKLSEPVGRGVDGPACFGIEIVFEYIGDLANGAEKGAGRSSINDIVLLKW